MYCDEHGTLDYCPECTRVEYAFQSNWQGIETAPKDGEEILGCRVDCEPFVTKWTSLLDSIPEDELEEMREEHQFTDEDLEAYNWFFADFSIGGILERDLEPTHWMPLPKIPIET